ncbi:MAG: ubiquitin-like small modifier protein 1 [Candidatus Bathyarchaeia archaeon]|jgi:molybdopterin synthase sulfur carrier subunit
MQVSVRFFTVLREITGKREENLQFAEGEKPTVSLALRKLTSRYGKDFADYVFAASGEVRGFLQFLVNGKSVAALNGLETQLADGDVLAIVPPVGGG